VNRAGGGAPDTSEWWREDGSQRPLGRYPLIGAAHVVIAGKV
jgi:hypothetical protein